MAILDELKKHKHTVEHNSFWVKPIQVRLIDAGCGFIDFQGKPGKSDVIGYGNTVEDAATEAINAFKKMFSQH